MGGDLVSILRNLVTSPEVRAEAIATAIYFFTGSRPIKDYGRDQYGEFVQIRFTDEQAAKLRAILEGWLAADPGDVRVEVGPVIKPIILKKAAPWMIGSTVLGGLAAKFGLRGW